MKTEEEEKSIYLKEASMFLDGFFAELKRFANKTGLGMNGLCNLFLSINSSFIATFADLHDMTHSEKLKLWDKMHDLVKEMLEEPNCCTVVKKNLKEKVENASH